MPNSAGGADALMGLQAWQHPPSPLMVPGIDGLPHGQSGCVPRAQDPIGVLTLGVKGSVLFQNGEVGAQWVS